MPPTPAPAEGDQNREPPTFPPIEGYKRHPGPGARQPPGLQDDPNDEDDDELDPVASMTAEVCEAKMELRTTRYLCATAVLFLLLIIMLLLSGSLPQRPPDPKPRGVFKASPFPRCSCPSVRVSLLALHFGDNATATHLHHAYLFAGTLRLSATLTWDPIRSDGKDDAVPLRNGYRGYRAPPATCAEVLRGNRFQGMMTPGSASLTYFTCLFFMVLITSAIVECIGQRSEKQVEEVVLRKWGLDKWNADGSRKTEAQIVAESENLFESWWRCMKGLFFEEDLPTSTETSDSCLSESSSKGGPGTSSASVDSGDSGVSGNSSRPTFEGRHLSPEERALQQQLAGAAEAMQRLANEGFTPEVMDQFSRYGLVVVPHRRRFSEQALGEDNLYPHFEEYARNNNAFFVEGSYRNDEFDNTFGAAGGGSRMMP